MKAPIANMICQRLSFTLTLASNFHVYVTGTGLSFLFLANSTLDVINPRCTDISKIEEVHERFQSTFTIRFVWRTMQISRQRFPLNANFGQIICLK